MAIASHSVDQRAKFALDVLAGRLAPLLEEWPPATPAVNREIHRLAQKQKRLREIATGGRA